jgi:hypothetical protein
MAGGDAFYLVVPTPQVFSHQGDAGRRGQPYQEDLREAARQSWRRRAVLGGDLYVRVAWFHPQPITRAEGADLDNILKPILDAVEGVAYDDDRAIVRCALSRHLMTETAAPQLPEAAPPWVQNKLDGLLAGFKRHYHVLYIEIGATNAFDVRLGPIDGVTA